jgi:hypothetical protein
VSSGLSSWVVVTFVMAGLAAWMGLGTLHQAQHADSLLTVLISTQKWTPFFWGQDRFGMLVPLVVMPVRDPLANLLVQGWVMTTSALLAPFVVARLVTDDAGDWIAIGAVANTLFLLVAAPDVQFDWLVTQPYGLSIALGFAALIVAERDRRWAVAAAFVLVLIACWVNIGIAVMLFIATAIKGSRRLRLLTLEAAAAAIASLAARYLAPAHTVTALAPARLWFDGWRQLLEGIAGVTNRPAIAIGLVFAAAAAAGWLWRAKRLPATRALLAIVALALGTWLVVGTSLWVGMNRYSFRYMYPTLMMAGVGAATMFTVLFAMRTRLLSAAAMVVLIGVAVASYGVPSLGRVNRSVDERFGRQTAAVLRNGATVIAGDYWRVWPAVFHANLALTRAHTHARVFGLAFRSEETDLLWKKSGKQVIAAWPDDQSVRAVADEHGVTLTLLMRLPEIDLYTGQP